MLQRIYGIGFILKVIFICLVILFLIINGALVMPLHAGKQSLDCLSAAVISVGFGATFCLIIYDKKKE